jgi:hypothetical protein
MNSFGIFILICVWILIIHKLSDVLFTYKIEDGHLVLFQYRIIDVKNIDIENITSIEISSPNLCFVISRHSSKIWARWVYVDYGRAAASVAISPKDPERFVAEILSWKPSIQVVRT